MARDRGFRINQRERARSRTKRKLDRWGFLDGVDAKEQVALIGAHSTTRRRCSCSMCKRENWRISRAGLREQARREEGGVA